VLWTYRLGKGGYDVKIAICEDEKACLDHLSRMLAELSGESRFDIDVVLACAVQEEFERFLETDTADVYLLDINLKSGTEGFYLALKIRESQPRSYIVFISEYLGTVFQSFKARPFDFLPKPVSKNVLKNLLIDIDRHMATEKQVPEPTDGTRTITIKSASKNYHVNKDDIIMIEKLKDKAFVYTTSARIPCNPTLEEFERLLADVKSVVRCHKGFIVNKKYILEEDPAQLVLKLEGGLKCYVSRNYRKRVFQ
jgi:DNA-binding LytR/AlgR family response regulator